MLGYKTEVLHLLRAAEALGVGGCLMETGTRVHRDPSVVQVTKSLSAKALEKFRIFPKP